MGLEVHSHWRAYYFKITESEGLKSPTKNCIKCSIELKVYQKKFQFFLVAIAVVIILYRIPIITVGAVAGKAYLVHKTFAA